MTKRVEAVQHIRRMRGGAQAHLMLCSDGAYYIVKFQNNPQGTLILANEMLGHYLATRLGLPTPDIAIVDVDERLIKFTEDLVVQFGRGRSACTPGACFGSRHVSQARRPGGVAQLAAYDFLPLELLPHVTNLADFAGMLVFDKWTCNTDGRQVVYSRGVEPQSYDAVMIDNGFCFNAAEWNFPDAPLRGLYALPSAYQGVQGIASFQPWLQLLEEKIDKKWIGYIAAQIPLEWYSPAAKSLSALIDTLERRRASVRDLLQSACAKSPRHFPQWEGKPGLIRFDAGCLELKLLKTKVVGLL
jgi:hypothetical protein